MSYKKGRILFFDFPLSKFVQDHEASKVLNGDHRAVILYSRSTPYNTVTIAPITTAEKLATANKIPDNYVELKKDNYRGILDHTSYINLDMSFVVDKKLLKTYCKNNKKINCNLKAPELKELDKKIVRTYELSTFINSEIKAEVGVVLDFVRDNQIEQMRILSDKFANSPDKKAVLDEAIEVLKLSYVDSINEINTL